MSLRGPNSSLWPDEGLDRDDAETCGGLLGVIQCLLGKTWTGKGDLDVPRPQAMSRKAVASNPIHPCNKPEAPTPQAAGLPAAACQS
jgi:hypothetical protein